MPTYFNHGHYPVLEYNLHAPAKYEAMERFGGLDSGRVLACSLPGDIVQLDPRLREQYDDLEAHLGKAGLQIGKVIFDTDPATVKQYPGYDLSVYGFNPTIHSVQPDPERLATTTSCHNKNQFIAWCAKEGFPIPRTYVSSYGPVNELADVPLPALVKPARSSAGLGIERVTTKKELMARLAAIGDRFEYQVQEDLVGATFFSEQYEIFDRTNHLASTGLFTHGFVYSGNSYPSAHSAREITDVAAEKLRHRGLKGAFGFDMAADEDDNKLFIECNARWTGGTYPCKVGKRLGALAWAAYKLPTDYGRLGDNMKRIDAITYTPATREGVVVINAGELLIDAPYQKQKPNLTFLIVGDSDTQTGLQTELEGRLTNGIRR